MNLQHQRIAEMCEQLKFARLAGEWPALAQDAARDEASFADFLEKVLASEQRARDERRVNTLMKLATMPVIKTLEQFDWSHAGGAPKAQILDSPTSRSCSAPRTSCLWAPAAWARRTSRCRWPSVR